jgi:hypothetical protein
MYGEVRQLSLLRMEFSGDSNTIDESRDFDELFKPITTFGPTSSTLPSFLTTESTPTLVVTSGDEEEEEEPMTSVLDKTSSISISSTSSLSISEADAPVSDDDVLPTTLFEGTTTEETGSGSGSESGVTEEPLPESTVNPPASGDEPVLSPATPDDEKTRQEGQVLFQDFERDGGPSPSSTTTEEPRIRTTNKVGV